MNMIFYLAIGFMLLASIYLLAGFIYSVIIILKQEKIFQKNLKVGDISNHGQISAIEGDNAIIYRAPLKIPIKDLSPTDYKANKLLFILGQIKNETNKEAKTS